jgi:RimJ/RimL family protein N-acetyltransferase
VAEPTQVITTARLELVPLRPADADEMVGVLADQRLYSFIGGGPPDRESLRASYARQAAGQSADGTEEWHNWIVRLQADGTAVGFVQATIVDAGAVANIAWLIGVPWQGRGFAVEAVRALVSWLDRRGIRTVVAHIRPDHDASGSVAARAGLEPTDELDDDGEQIWSRTLQEVDSRS